MEMLYQRAAKLADASRELFASHGIIDEHAKSSAVMAFAKNTAISEIFLEEVADKGYFNKSRMNTAVLVGLPFPLHSLIDSRFDAVRDSIDDLSTITPNTKHTATGKSELFLALGFPGATLINGGDVRVPNTLLGDVEVKSIKNDKSWCHITGGLDYSSRVARVKDRLEELGYENLKSLNFALVQQILEEDNEPADTLGSIASILTNQDLPRLGLNLSDTFIQKGNKVTHEDILGSYFIPLAQHAFREMKVARKFDVMLLINRESNKAVFIESSRDLSNLYQHGYLKFRPAGLSFRGDYSTGIGLSLGDFQL